MNEWLIDILRFVTPLLAFLFGSIPFALLITRAVTGLDIREHGSGNPGASNVFRVVGPAWGVLVLILDGAKGAIPVAAAGWLAQGLAPDASIWYRLLIGLLAGAGHIWSPFLNFQGGKGVATFSGVFLVLFPQAFLVAMVSALFMVVIFRYFSLGSIVGSISLPISYFVFIDTPMASENLPLLGICMLAALLILARHTDNLKRLIRGEELRIVKKGAAPKDPGRQEEN